MGLGKETPVGESLDWPLTSMLGGVACILGDCELLCDSQDAPKLQLV